MTEDKKVSGWNAGEEFCKHLVDSLKKYQALRMYDDFASMTKLLMDVYESTWRNIYDNNHDSYEEIEELYEEINRLLSEYQLAQLRMDNEPDQWNEEELLKVTARLRIALGKLKKKLTGSWYDSGLLVPVQRIDTRLPIYR